jgi:ABC-type bacteriocin/lantibiotic exporter with double-glycine peptidase domain
MLWSALRLRERLAELDGRISGLVFQLLGAVSKLRVTASERRGFAVWSRLYAESTRLTFTANACDNLIATVNSMVPVLSSAAVFWLVHRSLHPGAGQAPAAMSVGGFVAFTAAFTLFLNAGMALSTTAFSVLNVVPTWRRARPILEARPEVDSARPSSKPLAGSIQAHHLTFRYKPDGPKILDDVSFTVEPGEFVALVGPSGSGKSTVLRLLLGFETPEIGSIYYDGQDLSKFDAGSIRRQIGVVLQNGRLLAGDIFTNIVGNLPLTIDDAWAAAEAAGVADDIRAMPMGMFTVISEGASTLSGGQRQRIIIARALVRNPKKIYFDEATSALDNRTQEIVTQSLAKMKVSRVVIAHRLSTVREADKIIVMAKGRIVQQGTFDQLMKEGGLFRELASRQVA